MKKKLQKKFALNKNTIINLNDKEQMAIAGGVDTISCGMDETCICISKNGTCLTCTEG